MKYFGIDTFVMCVESGPFRNMGMKLLGKLLSFKKENIYLNLWILTILKN